ncbi:MAG: SbcC/MukB-like Walker B domain-containing protein, partial [candidate division Zixibacteria bacterium]
IGASLIGPHRDSLDITINGHPLRQFGSLGQKKTVMIAMKLATLETLSEHRREPAILIMDEAFAELDRTRGKALLNLLSDGGQVFLASATMGGLERETMTTFEVSDGSVNKVEA